MSTPYAVLDNQGNLVAGNSADSRQDPASTTKVWTMYTIMSMVRDGVLPASFLREHRGQIQQMLVHSNNHSAQELARAAARAAGVDPGPVNGYLNTVPGFANFMNYYADPEHNQNLRPRQVSDQEDAANRQRAGGHALSHSHFVSVSGMPVSEHYSTARDMAMMLYRFRNDFRGSDLAEWVHAADLDQAGSTGSFASRHSDIGKTGTAGGMYGSEGRYSFVGATDDGVYAIAGAPTKANRISMAGRLATMTHQRGGGSMPPLPDNTPDESPDAADDIDTRDYLRPSERTRRDSLRGPNSSAADRAEADRIDAEARRRRQEAEQYDPSQDPEQFNSGLVNALLQFFMAIFGVRPQQNGGNAGPDTSATPLPAPAPQDDPVITTDATMGQTLGNNLKALLDRVGGNADGLIANLGADGVTRSELSQAAQLAVSAGVVIDDNQLNSLDFDNSGRLDAADVQRLSQMIRDRANAPGGPNRG